MAAARHIIIIGAGITGCSAAYHLALRGHKAVTVIDRGTIAVPLGSTGHAPGLLGRNSASPVMAKLADYTAELYSAIPADAPAFARVGSVEVARDSATMALLQRKAATAHSHGFSVEIISGDQLKTLVPYIDNSAIVGAIHLPDDGTLEARTALNGLHDAARGAGVAFIENVEVYGFVEAEGRVVGVRTSDGEFEGDAVLVAAGIWGAEFLRRQGLDLPLFPVQHPYVYTQMLPELIASDAPAVHPIVRDLDNLFYLREHHGRLGYGWYNHPVAPAQVESIIRADIAFPENGFLNHASYALFPFLEGTPIESRLNGIFSMTPDGAPLVGAMPGKPGLWVAEAVWVTHSGGIGRAIAEMLCGDSPSIDVSCFQPARFSSVSSDSQLASALSRYNDIYTWPGD